MNTPHNETSVHVETMYILSHAADAYASTKHILEHNALSIDIYSGSQSIMKSSSVMYIVNVQ